MSRLRSVARRFVPGWYRTRRDIAEIKTTLRSIEEHMATVDRVVQALNHEVRHGAGDSLPLFLGYAERLRLDAETAVGVTQVIERRLIELEARLDSIARG